MVTDGKPIKISQEASNSSITEKLSISSILRAYIKRLVDIGLSAFGLILLAPLFLVIAMRIRRMDPGPVFYHGPRVGKGGKLFNIVKFRTMYDSVESYNGARITAKHDTRITPIGRWLRDSKLNELPQLWNVLKGDMSLVGPRPEDPEIFAGLPEDYKQDVIKMRPGMTSPASIVYYDEENRLDQENPLTEYMNVILPDKMRMDQLYVRHHNLFRDLDTIFWTFIILVPRIGRHRILEGWLLDGPITRFMRRYFNWFIIDTIIAFTAIALLGISWRLVEPLDVGVVPALLMGIFLSFSFGLVNTILGLKTVSWHNASAGDVLKLVLSCLIVNGIYIGQQVIFPIGPSLPPFFTVGASIIACLGFVVMRYRTRLLTGLATRWVKLRKSSIGSGERVLIVGAGKTGEFAAWMLRSTEFRPYYQVIGYVDDNPAKQGMRFDGIRVLGTTTDIPDMVSRHNIGMLVFGITNIHPRDKARVLNVCQATKLPIVFVPEVIAEVRRKFVESVQLQEKA